MGHMGNEPHRGKVVQGVWRNRGQWGMGLGTMRPTGGMGYRGMGHLGNRSHGQWGKWAMGHMGNGAYGPWGTWAMGHMGDLNFFAYNFINTGWILTKILLDIDINVFYLNTPRFFHDGLN